MLRQNETLFRDKDVLFRDRHILFRDKDILFKDKDISFRNKDILFWYKDFLFRDKDMDRDTIIHHIRAVGRDVLPAGSNIYLYGAQTVAETDVDAEWELLILLNQKTADRDDEDLYTFPFIKLGWNLNKPISAMLYTKQEWHNVSFSPLYQKVERSKTMVL